MIIVFLQFLNENTRAPILQAHLGPRNVMVGRSFRQYWNLLGLEQGSHYSLVMYVSFVFSHLHFSMNLYSAQCCTFVTCFKLNQIDL